MSTIRGYDEWKTAAPEYPEWSGYAEVADGQLILSVEDGSDPEDYLGARPTTVEIDNEPESVEADDARIVEEIKTWLRHQMYVTEFMCSSSVDFPEEYGVTRKINIRELMAQALERQ